MGSGTLSNSNSDVAVTSDKDDAEEMEGHNETDSLQHDINVGKVYTIFNSRGIGRYSEQRVLFDL